MYTSTNSYSLGLQHSRIRGYVLLTLGQVLINNFPFPTPLLWFTGSKTPSYLPFSYLFPQGVRCWQRKWCCSIAWPAALGEGPTEGPTLPTRATGLGILSSVTLSLSTPPGGTLLTAEVALERGLACSTGGGTHHAYPGYGSGYCLINDLAVAAAALLQQGAVHRVLVVDLDVHQVDGPGFVLTSHFWYFNG